MAEINSGITIPSSGFFRQFWQKQGTVVQGTWSWHTDILQTDFASVTEEGAGVFFNTAGGANFDEYKWTNIFLSPGTYKVTIAYFTFSGSGIVEVLFGNLSIGTIDLYSAITTYNLISTLTFTISSPTTADFRFRVNGKNILSTGYTAYFARIHIEKTA